MRADNCNNKGWCYWIVASFCLIGPMLLSSCGVQSTAKAFQVDYYFADNTINTTSLVFYIDAQNGDGYQYRIDGENFSADVALGEFNTIQNETTISYTDEAEYTADFAIYRADGTPYLEDTITWHYSTIVPPDPVVSFSEEATADTRVWLRVAATKGEYTNEIYIEGDTADGEPFWTEIPSNLQVGIDTTESDGTKSFTVKYRNVFGTESANSANVSILKKSVGASTCTATLSSDTTPDGRVRIQASAADPLSTYINISGELASSFSEKKFTGSGFYNLLLVDSGEDGQSQISVSIRDVAGTLCLSETKTITWDDSVTYYGMEIEGDPIWTTEDDVTVNLYYPNLPLEPIEMYIDGDVADTADTLEWVEYTPTKTLTLRPSEGARSIGVRYRKASDPTGSLTPKYTDFVFLNPYFNVSGSSSPYTISPAEINGLSTVTITGCDEAYNAVKRDDNGHQCSADSGDEITVTFTFSDGTSTSTSRNLP